MFEARCGSLTASYKLHTYKLQVTSYKLQVTSYKLQVTMQAERLARLAAAARVDREQILRPVTKLQSDKVTK